jgi:hypothetical protein
MKTPYSLPEEQRERLKRSEFEAVRCLMGAVSYAAHAKDDLQDRLQCIPNGKQRMNMAIGSFRSIANDILGTITYGQNRQLLNTMNDMDMRMVPKMTRMTTNVIYELEIAKSLVNIAMEKCTDCVEDSRSCRKCALYQVLESTMPLENYDSLSCPYSRSEWEE